MLRRDGAVPEDHLVCQESQFHTRLCVLASQRHEDKPGPGGGVFQDAGGRRRTSGRPKPGNGDGRLSGGMIMSRLGWRGGDDNE